MAKATDSRKKVDKIYSQITRVAQKGKDYSLEYHKLIDEIVAKGDYAYLEMCLSDYYNIDPVKYKTVYSIKTKTWKNILFETDATMIGKLKRLYKEKNVYQQGQEIRSDDVSYLNIDKKGPYIAEEVGTKTSYNTEVKRTKYNLLPGSLNQIELAKSATGIDISLIDDKIYKVEVAKVIWATFSVPLYTKQVSMTQSVAKEGDLLVVKMKELNRDGSFRDGGIDNSVFLKTIDIQDFSTKALFIGSGIGSKNKVDVYKIYKSGENVAALLGIDKKSLIGMSNLFEATILEIRRRETVEVESPYELNRISTILPGTQSYLLPNVANASGIPTTHGGDYLVTTYRRDSVGWYQPGLTNEVYSYRVDIRKDNLLGTIKEIDDETTPGHEYLQRNKQFAQIMGIKRTFLEVEKTGATSSILIKYDNQSVSEESNLYTRYKIAIDYLNS